MSQSSTHLEMCPACGTPAEKLPALSLRLRRDHGPFEGKERKLVACTAETKWYRRFDRLFWRVEPVHHPVRGELAQAGLPGGRFWIRSSINLRHENETKL